MTKTVRALQAQLQLDNFYLGSLDGLYGSKTAEATRKAIETGNYKIDFNFAEYKRLFNETVLTQKFVDSVNGLFQVFNEYNNEGGTNLLYVAYMLATSYHETAYTMQAIKEYGSYKYLSKYDTGRLAKVLGNTPEADGDGILYAGRGHVMITGLDNYKKFTKLLGIDLVKNPDLALDPVVSAKILTIGSLRGVFTTKKLSDYIRTGKRLDFIRARAVINGTDKAESIALHAEKFLACITLVKCG